MKKFRITKYDPCFRNDSGKYLRNEWSSYYDIGKAFCDGILTKSEYLKKEEAYIQAVELLCDANELNSMRVVKLEKHCPQEIYTLLSREEKSFVNDMQNEMLVERHDMSKVCKMILREIVWAQLESTDESLRIEFGYDYYMYAICKVMSEKLRKKIRESGLFVEEM